MNGMKELFTILETEKSVLYGMLVESEALFEAELTKPQIREIFDRVIRYYTKRGANRTGIGMAKDTLVSEGPISFVKHVAGKIANKAKEIGTNMTTRFTPAKLDAAWKRAGSPTGSKYVAKVLVSAGVEPPVVAKIFGKMGIKVPKSLGRGSVGSQANHFADPFSGGVNQSHRGYAPQRSIYRRRATAGEPAASQRMNAGPDTPIEPRSKPNTQPNTQPDHEEEIHLTDLQASAVNAVIGHWLQYLKAVNIHDGRTYIRRPTDADMRRFLLTDLELPAEPVDMAINRFRKRKERSAQTVSEVKSRVMGKMVSDLTTSGKQMPDPFGHTVRSIMDRNATSQGQEQDGEQAKVSAPIDLSDADVKLIFKILIKILNKSEKK